MDDSVEPLLPAREAAVPQGVLEALHGAAIEFLVSVGDEKADVPVPLPGQVVDGAVGGVVIVHLDEGNGAVLGHVGVHAEVGEVLLLQKMNHLLVAHLDEDDAVGVLAVDGAHEFAALGVGLHGSEDNAVAQHLALAEDSGEHVHGKEVEEAEVILAHDNVDGVAAL